MNSLPGIDLNFTDDRLDALRRWIAAGGHNSPEVAESVARRILACGDLRGESRDDRSLPRGSPFHRFGRDDRLIH
jgi:hypothetical protein